MTHPFFHRKRKNRPNFQRGCPIANTVREIFGRRFGCGDCKFYDRCEREDKDTHRGKRKNTPKQAELIRM